MIDAAALDILLNDRRIGTLARLDGDRSIFTFDEAYLADEERPTLSVAYRDQYGSIINAPRAYQTQIEPFFSNLLPEGAMRDYLARRTGIKSSREYLLLAQLGGDLPGAVKAVPAGARGVQPEDPDEEGVVADAKRALRLSLAGVQRSGSPLTATGGAPIWLRAATAIICSSAARAPRWSPSASPKRCAAMWKPPASASRDHATCCATPPPR